MRSCHSHLVPTEPWDFDTSWNILWFLSAARSSAPSQSEGNQSRRSQTSDSHLPAAARCLWFSRPVEKAGEREREGNRERQTAEKRWNPKCHVPEAFISPNEMETAKGKHCFAFLKIVFPVEWVEKKISFPFPVILRDLFAKSAGLGGETRSIYFLYTLVIYEVAINAEFMEVKSGHEIKRILFKYPSLLILSNSSQRRRWVRMHTQFTEY